MLLSNQKSLSQISKSASLGLDSDTQSFFTSTISAGTSFVIGNITMSFNSELNTFLSDLNVEKNALQIELEKQLGIDPSFDGLRNKGVSLAWKYERADAIMGGSGTVDGGWNEAERQQIINTGRAKVFDPKFGTYKTPEGHHIKNVANHPEKQADPDNIMFYKTRDEHVNKGHNGNTNNPSDGELIDKNAKLRQTNRNRVIKNELCGIALSAGIGFGLGFTLSTIAELAINGISSTNVGELLLRSTITGFETAFISTIGYCAGRLAMQAIQSFGIDATTKIGVLFNFGAVGLASIMAISIYQYVKIRLSGMNRDVAAEQVGKQCLFSISVLCVSIIAQGIYGGYAGIIVSTSIGLAYFCSNLSRMMRQKEQEEKLRVNTIIAYKELVLD